MITLPLAAVRSLALHAQGLATPPAGTPTPDTIHRTVERLTCVQIDTLHLVRRSHYLVLWSRLGTYDPADFDRLIYDPAERRLFEYWQHAASIIPLSEYRYRLPYMHSMRNGGGWWPQWIKDPQNAALVEQVISRIREEGPLRTANFDNDGAARGTWWDWKPAKRALEHLYNQGDLMITDRVNFHRVYDLRERVLPDWVDTSLPTPDDVARHLVERAARAAGIAEPVQVAAYAYEVKRTAGRRIVADLVNEGVLVEVMGEWIDGQMHSMVIHRDNLPLAEQAAGGSLRAEHTTFLSPFDSLLWTQDRNEQIWGFWTRLEAYKPAPQRIYGYFCLPILWRDRLIGRFDPKLERKTGTLRLKSLHLEPGIELADEMIAEIAGALRDFMRFHDARDLVIESSNPAAFGEKVLAAV